MMLINTSTLDRWTGESYMSLSTRTGLTHIETGRDRGNEVNGTRGKDETSV